MSTHQEDRERLARERRVADMQTRSILWFLVHRHSVQLLIGCNILTIVLALVVILWEN